MPGSGGNHSGQSSHPRHQTAKGGATHGAGPGKMAHLHGGHPIPKTASKVMPIYGSQRDADNDFDDDRGQSGPDYD